MKRTRQTILATALITSITCIPSHGEVERREANNGNVVLEGVPEVPASLTASIDRFLEVRSAGFSDWTADGSAVYVTTRFGNVRQLHRVAGPGAYREQLTFFDEPIAGIDREPNGDRLTFLMDEGGSEFTQIFLFDPASGSTLRLTDGASRNRAVEWSRAGDKIAFQSTRRNGRSNDIWVADVDDPQSARLVFEAPDGSWWAAADWSSDDTLMLVSQYVSVTDSRIHLLNPTSGESRLLAGSVTEASKNLGIGPRFSADGEGVFFATDRNSDITRLAYMSLDSGEVEILTEDITWDVDGFTMSENRNRAAFVVNEGGIDRLYLLDATSHAYSQVESIPVGLIGGMAFHPTAGLWRSSSTPPGRRATYSLSSSVTARSTPGRSSVGPSARSADSTRPRFRSPS